jgi:hypothetical protein
MTTGGTYVYGVWRAEASMPPAPPAGIEDRPVFAIECGPLAALASDAPAGPVRASRRNLMAHSGVLQAAVTRACVLPMRFGVVMPDPDGVESDLLRAHEDVLLAQLEAFDTLVEVELKLLCEEEALLRAIVAERDDVAALHEHVRRRPADATYYERIRLGELIAQAVDDRRGQLLQRVVARLEPLTVETSVNEVAHDQMLVNAAFLVERARLAEVDAAVRELDVELGPGMTFRYVGPLPPYHFVETAAGTESPSWA